MSAHPVLIVPALVGLLARAAQLLFIALVIALALIWQAATWLLGLGREH